MQSAAHEAIASVDFTYACVSSSHSPHVLDSLLLAAFVEGRGVWVRQDQRSVDLHVCPGAGIAAAYLHYHHVYVPRLPAITRGPAHGCPEPGAPIDVLGAVFRVSPNMLDFAAWEAARCDVAGCPAYLCPGELICLSCALRGRYRFRPDVGVCRRCHLLGRISWCSGYGRGCNGTVATRDLVDEASQDHCT